MTASYTPNGRITKQGTNDNPNTWGSVLNTQVITLLEEMSKGVEDVDITGSGTVTLTTLNGASDQARNAVLELTGTIGANIEVHVPSVEWVYLLRGAWAGAYTVTVKINGSSTGVVMSSGDLKSVYTNGTDIYDLVDLTGRLLNTNDLSDVSSVPTARTNLGLGTAAIEDTLTILESIYPVGSLYMNATVLTNPATLLGFGTWTAFGEGRVLLGVGQGTDDNAVNKTYALGDTDGEYVHTLTEAELPAHEHDITTNSENDDGNGAVRSSTGTSVGFSSTTAIQSTGGGTAHNNEQPSIAVYIWKRTV